MSELGEVRGEETTGDTLPRLRQRMAIPRLELLVEMEGGEPASRTIVHHDDLCRIGSHPGNDVVLLDPQVSRFHCRLAVESQRWRVIDMGSTNGTLVESVIVRDADLPVPECRIRLGASVVRVRELVSADPASVPQRLSFGSLSGSSIVMRRLFELLERVSKSDSTVLIEGESGTGKEVVATEIVRHGPRADKPLVVVDCGAISPSLVESELFGHARGAFTGADRERVGAFEAANGGTIFLDEVGELPIEIQPKLLRVLESRELRRVGETSARKVNVRVIAATNRTLEREVNQRRFREDLFFRLSVVAVRVPPLRERLDDLGILTDIFLRSLGVEGAGHLFTDQVLEEMARYDWPGNVRELRNYVERAAVLQSAGPTSSPNGIATAHATTQHVPVDLDLSFKDAKDRAIESFERAYLGALLQWSDGNVSRAARRAGMDRIHLHRLLQRHGLRAELSVGALLRSAT